MTEIFQWPKCLSKKWPKCFSEKNRLWPLQYCCVWQRMDNFV